MLTPVPASSTRPLGTHLTYTFALDPRPLAAYFTTFSAASIAAIVGKATSNLDRMLAEQATTRRADAAPCAFGTRPARSLASLSMADFEYQDVLPLGADDTPYRLLTTDGVSTFEAGGERFLRVEPEALTRLTREACATSRHLFRPGHLPQLRQHPRRPRGLGQRPLRGPRPAAERQHRRRQGPARRARTPAPPSCIGKKGQRVWTGGDDEAASGARHLRDLHARQPALLADGAADDVRRGQHRHQPARRRSTSTPPTATPTISCSSPRAAARRTRRSSSRRPRRCSTRRRCSPSSTRRCARSAPPPARRTTWPSSSAARRPRSR